MLSWFASQGPSPRSCGAPQSSSHATPQQMGRFLARHASSGSTPTVAVVGAGWWSQGWHLPQLARNPRVRLGAVVDPSTALRSTLNPDMEQLEEVGSRYGVPTFRTTEELLASEAGAQLQGVVVASSHAAHASAGRAAIARGLHVLMEKPMTTDPVEAYELAALAEAAGTWFAVNNTANWRRGAVDAHRAVSDGRIGTVQHAHAYMGSPLLWLFDDPANEGWVRPTGAMVGNGFGWGQLSHTLAWIIMVSGLRPVRVSCNMVYSSRTGADLYDSATMQCEGGATLSVEGVASLPGANPVSSKQIENRIFGTEGFVQYSGLDQDPESGCLLLRRHDGVEERSGVFEFENYEQEGTGPESLNAFVDACAGATDVWNGCDASTGALVVAVIDAMYRSARAGQPVDVYGAGGDA